MLPRCQRAEPPASRRRRRFREKRPDGLRYVTFKGPDGVTFFHLASIEAGHNPLSEIAAFKEFHKDINDRCDEPPAPTDLETIGHFRFFE